MAFYKNYSPGETFEHTAARENDISKLLNQTPGIGGGKIAGKTPGTVRLKCYNSSASGLTVGTAVEFDSDNPMCEDSVPVKALSDVSKPWGVLEFDLSAGEFGSVIVSGPAKVTLSGSGSYAAPSSTNPAVFTRGATGTPLLFVSGTTGIVLLGGGAVGYNGYFTTINTSTKDGETTTFKIKVVDGSNPSSSICGYAIISDTQFAVMAAEVAVPGSGFIYLKATIDETTTPATILHPIFEFQSSHQDFDGDIVRVLIARVVVDGTSMKIIQEQHGEIRADFPGDCD